MNIMQNRGAWWSCVLISASCSGGPGFKIHLASNFWTLHIFGTKFANWFSKMDFSSLLVNGSDFEEQLDHAHEVRKQKSLFLYLQPWMERPIG